MGLAGRRWGNKQSIAALHDGLRRPVLAGGRVTHRIQPPCFARPSCSCHLVPFLPWPRLSRFTEGPSRLLLPWRQLCGKQSQQDVSSCSIRNIYMTTSPCSQHLSLSAPWNAGLSARFVPALLPPPSPALPPWLPSHGACPRSMPRSAPPPATSLRQTLRPLLLICPPTSLVSPHNHGPAPIVESQV